MFRSLLLTLLLIVSKLCFAQETREQLYNQLAQHQPDTVRLKTLYHLANFYFARDKKRDADSAEYYFKKSLSLCDSLKRERGMNIILCRMGEFYLDHNHITQARQCYDRAAVVYNTKEMPEKEVAGYRQIGDLLVDKALAGGNAKKRLLLKLADVYYQKAKYCAGAYRDTDKMIGLLSDIAYKYYAAHLYEPGQRVNQEVINKFGQTTYPAVNRAYILISEENRWVGNYNHSLYYMLKGLKRVDRLNDTIYKHFFYGELALIYEGLGQIDKSIEWYKKTLQLRETIKGLGQEYLFRTAGFLALALIKQHKAKEASRIISGLERRHQPQHEDGRAFLAQAKAYCYDNLGQYQLAEKNYLISVGFYEKMTGNNEVKALAYYDIAKFYVKQKQYNKAYYYIKGQDQQNLRTNLLRDVHLLMFKIDSARGKLNTALAHFQQYKLLNDSIFNTAKSKQIEELQIKYATDQKERDMASLKKDRERISKTAAEATSARNITFLGIVLLLVIVGLLYNSFRLNRKKTIEIDRKNAALSRLITEKDDLLEEKEWLMKEIHHRVKNNLQIVMGLLQRQSAFIDNKEALAAIQNSENRMYSVALIHQKLYQSDSFTLVDMADYIDEMAGYLQEGFELGSRILFEKQTEHVALEINVAVPLGLILNETVTNAIKYAFPAEANGCIKIIFKQTAANSYLLQVADNGVGLPAGFDMAKTNSMGFNLVRGLSKQIGGKIDVVNDGGLTISIAFKTDTQNG